MIEYCKYGELFIALDRGVSMKNKFRNHLLLVAIFALTSLVGCGSEENEPEEVYEPTTVPEVVYEPTEAEEKPEDIVYLYRHDFLTEEVI